VEDIGVIESVDFVESEVVAAEGVEDDAVCKTVNGFCTPAQRICKPAELLGEDAAELTHNNLHVIVIISGTHPELFAVELLLKKRQSVFHNPHPPQIVSARNMSSDPAVVL